MKLSIEPLQDRQTVTPDWRDVTSSSIEGVTAREVKHVLTGNGTLVELLRSEWLPPPATVGQVFLRTLDPGGVSAWHVHRTTVDRLFCIAGRALIVLFDAREGSPTFGVVSEYRVGAQRPTLVIVPAGVFHGVKALGPDPIALVNMPDAAYSYTSPDHWRVPQDTPDIPYRFP